MMLDRKLLILYGSQTGTAQDAAERVWREAKFYNFSGPVQCMNDYAINNLIFEPLVIFIVSTTGQGEEPENMKLFWKFLLRKSLPSDSLKTVNFAVLGFGDSSYSKFNFVAKRLTRRLCNLGGTPIIDTGYADDQHDLGADFVVDSWLKTLWKKLGTLLNFTPSAINLKLEPRWRIGVAPNSAADEEQNELPQIQKYNQRYPCVMHIIDNIRTTALDHFQDVRLIKLKVPTSLRYNPGDVLMLGPKNSENNVKKLFEILNCNRSSENAIRPETVVEVHEKNSDLPVPEPLRKSIRLIDCAMSYWDLNCVPRRHVFALLSESTTDELEKEKLKEFSEAAGQEDLYNYCNRPKRTILEVLADFPFAAKAVSLDMLFDILQPIKPRAFSICSSPSMHKNEIHILVAIVEYKTKLMVPRHGLCSSYLAALPKGSVLHGWIQGGSFNFPSSTSSVIMIGPGTGVAPFRSFIQEKVANKTASDSSILLFFGCRKKEADFHFRKEWEELSNKSQIKLITAFSRDQSEKIYVQQKISEYGSDVWDRLNKGSFVLVAGSSKNMPASVREAFVNIVSSYGGKSSQDAERFIQNMEKLGSYQTETWS